MSPPTLQDHPDDHNNLLTRINLLEAAARSDHPSPQWWNQALSQLFQRLHAIDSNHMPAYQRTIALKAMDVPFRELLLILEVESFPSKKIMYSGLIWSRNMHASGIRHVYAYGFCTFELDSAHDAHHNAVGVIETILHEMAHAIPSRYLYYCDCERLSCAELRWKMDGKTGNAYSLPRI